MLSRRRLGTSVPLLCLLLHPAAAMAAWEVNMPRGVTDVSQDIYSLHMTIFWICVVIAVIVFGVMLWSILFHRKSQGAKPSNFHEHTTIEIVWTLIPFAILITMAIPATATLVEMYDTSDSDVDIKVTGYQWKWRYDYLNEEFGFLSTLTTPQDAIYNQLEKTPEYLLEVDEPMVVPINKKIRFLFTANDVIHSWWVPELAVKKDAIPGFINEAWTRINEPGIYRGQCAELCGKDHAFMPVVVKAVPEEEYEIWVAERQQKAREEYELRNKEWTLEELMARGEKVYGTSCASCHMPDGNGLPPAFPALRGSAIVTQDMPRHIDIVLNGVPGTAMQAFRDQLGEIDLAAVITYERNAWGNETGEIVTPLQIMETMEQ